MATSGDKCHFTCSVCLQAFRDPRVLPCCHTFCRACLEGVLEKAASKRKLICPQCRGEHSVPLKGVEGFLSDFTVGVEVSDQSMSIRPDCGECDSSDPCISYCCDCQSHLCGYCDTTHKRVKRWQNHTVLPLESVTSDTIKTSSLSCWKHPSEQLKIFCKTCQIVVCCNCIIESHSDGHSYTAVNKATRDEVEEQLKIKLKQAQTKLVKVQADLSHLKKAEQQVGTQPNELKRAVNEAFDKIIATLETRRSQLLKEADDTCTGDLKVVWAEKERMETAVVGLETAVGFTQRTLQCAQDAKFLSLSSQASTRLDQLEGISWEMDKIKAIEQVCRVFQGDVAFVGGREMIDIESFGHLKQAVVLSLQNFPQTLELAVETQLTLCGGIGVNNIAVKGSYGRSKKQFMLRPQKMAGGKCVITFLPVCAGPHSLSIFINSNETEGSPFRFTVHGAPTIGTRVARGPDWHYGNEDGGPGNYGTVDTHVDGSCRLYVRWDNGNRYDYSWGAGNKYDVVVVK